MSISRIKKLSHAEVLEDRVPEDGAPEVVESITAQAAAGLQRLIEGEIRVAIGRFLGRSNFTFDELRGRCQRVMAPSGDETWFVDDTAVLLVYPCELVEFDDHGKHVYEARRSVRQLRF